MKKILMESKMSTLAVLLFGLVSCNEELEFEEHGITLVQVVDEWTGEPIPNATVKIYNHVDDWAFEENQRQSLTSDEDGNIKLKGLSDGEYFLDVIKDGMSNWQYPYGVSVYQGSINIDQVPISHNFNYFISSADGKDWEITHIYDEIDNDISDDPDFSCMVGNQVHFEKAGHYTMDDGSNSCDTLPQFREASWWGYGQTLFVLINSIDIHEYYVATFEEDHFILFDNSGSSLTKYRYERL